MTADVLRQAARLMRERAEAASTGNAWHAYAQDCDAHVGGVDEGPHVALVGRLSWPGVADQAAHIASWHPAVALAVADLLDDYAGFLERERLRFVAAFGEDHADDFLPEHPHLLAVAQTYLGGES